MQRLTAFLVTVCLLVFQVGLMAQNLIGNPGFEDYHGCPMGNLELNQIAGWKTNLNTHTGDTVMWHYRNYIHTCDPDVDPYWNAAFGEGVLHSPYIFDPVNDSFKWADVKELKERLRADYYVNTDLRSVITTSDWSLYYEFLEKTFQSR